MIDSPGRVALITGASRGIGAHLAQACAAGGVAVAVNCVRDVASAEAVVTAIQSQGGTAFVAQADCADAQAVSAMVQAVLERRGRIDYLVNNAGIGVPTSHDDLDEAAFEHVLRTNLMSAFLVSRAVLPHMLAMGFGRIIFLSSLAARTGGHVSAAYAASKGGLEGLMHYYATAFARQGVTAKAVAPALIATDMVAGMTHPPVETLPMGRLGEPSEVWPAVRMLFDSAYVTGQTIHVNAGMYMT